MFIIQIGFNFLLFLLGIMGVVLNRRSLILILMSLELTLLSVNLNFICFSIFFDDIVGQIFALIVLAVAAAESAIGLAIFILHYRVRGNISVGNIPSLRY
jgi:NADH:ubiquinone oxidoreductase subunit K